ncbi:MULTISPECIES: carboxypeptidase regulatory-like domain-containing protein [unclassified Nocardioides]|uniref:carboxypeptidase regulatory-like domain-containing protein n=1 Tax=unclassified Nocardioides TaxID=2615069 RepID=UPI003014CEB1
MQQHRAKRSASRIARWTLAGALAVGTLGALGGTATAAPAYEVSGTVTGEGRPLWGEIHVYRENSEGTAFDYFTRVTTNGPGPFSANLGDGVYKFEVRDWDRSRYRNEWYDDADSIETADEVVVNGGKVSLGTIDLALRPTVTGRVTGPDGRPLSDVRVTSYRPEGAGDGDWSNTSTDREGRFYLTPSTGPWLVEFEDDRSEYATEWYSDAPTWSGATVVTYDGSEVVDLGEVRLSAGASITGRVTDAVGAVARGIETSLYDAEGNYVTEVRTNRRGVYRLARLAPGSYRLRFSDPEEEYETEYWKDADQLESAAPIVVARDQAVTGRDVVLAPSTSTEPSGVDVTGLVVDAAGQPVRGVRVGAVAATGTSSELQFLDNTVTDRLGRYRLLDLDPESLALNGYDSTLSTFRLGFTDGSGDDELDYLDTWLGGTRNSTRSTTVGTRAGAAVTAPTTRIQQYGGVRGTVASVYGDVYEGQVEAYDVDGNLVSGDSIGRGGVFEVRDLLPGEAYRLRFEGWDDEHSLIRTWWRTGANFTTATPVVARAGEWTSGIDVVLTDQVTALARPTVTGSPVVGGTLTATSGSWNVSAGSELGYAWLRGGTVVGTGRTYRPTVADAGRRLSVRVTNWASDYYAGGPTLMSVPTRFGRSGTATSAATAVVRNTSRATATASYNKRRKAVTLTVKVAVPGTASPAGTVSVREGGRTVRAGVKLVRGVATVTVKKPRKGKRTYAVSYSGTTSVLPSKTAATVRVK